MSASTAHPDGLGNRSDQVGRNLMFHNFTLGAALFPIDVQPLRAQSTTLEIDDLVGPFTGPTITALGVPYIAGGIVQVGSGAPLLQEAILLAAFTGHGSVHKQLMRLGPVHSRVAGSQLIHEDLPQATNRVDLDPSVRDLHGLPSGRITYSPHRHEQVAAQVLGAQLLAAHEAAPGAIAAAIIPYPLIEQGAIYTAHLAGTARMGTDADTTVCDADGRLHEVDNVVVVDGSTFPTFPGFNPTLTIMANSLRIARVITGAAVPGGTQPRTDPPPLPATGGGGSVRILPVIAGAAAVAARAARQEQT